MIDFIKRYLKKPSVTFAEGFFDIYCSLKIQKALIEKGRGIRPYEALATAPHILLMLGKVLLPASISIGRSKKDEKRGGL